MEKIKSDKSGVQIKKMLGAFIILVNGEVAGSFPTYEKANEEKKRLTQKEK